MLSLAVVNARIRTGDPRRPWADGLAVRDDRLALVGSSAEVRKLAGGAGRVLDARGALVVPAAPDARLARGEPASFSIVRVEGPTAGLPEADAAHGRVLVTVLGGRVVYEGDTLDP